MSSATLGRDTALCDVDRRAAEKVASKWCSGAELYEDYRQLVARDDLDAVLVTAPDHWHAPIAQAALKAGKAVYCEKPLTQTIQEGRELVATAEAGGKPLLVGLQQRVDWRFRTAAELVRNGRLGKVHTAYVRLTPRRDARGTLEVTEPPPGLNWDFWLGTAPLADYCSKRHLDWHEWWDYAGGEMTNMGPHHVDIVQWALGLSDTGPIMIDGTVLDADTAAGLPVPKLFTVKCVFASGFKLIIETTGESKGGVEFLGDAGSIWVSRTELTGLPVDQLTTHPLPPDTNRLHPTSDTKSDATRHHLRHFYACVRGFEKPIADVLSAHRSTSTCHLANIALRLGRRLRWDPVKERFVDDSEANALCSRTMRSTYL